MSNRPFTDIPVRANCAEVTAAWWNLLRTAGINLIENVFGKNLIVETQISIADGQGATNATGLVFDKTAIVAAVIRGTSKSSNTSFERRHVQTIRQWYNTKKNDWRIHVDEVGEECTAGSCTSVPSGLTFTVTSAGQLQIAADTIGSTPVRSWTFKAVETFDLET